MIVIESGFAGVTYPLAHPRMGAFPLGGTITASSAAAGFPASDAALDTTHQWWRPTAMPATWELAFPVSSPVSYFGIAAHDLATVGATVIYETWNGTTWDVRLTHTPVDNMAIFGLVVRRTLAKARLRFTGAEEPTVGVIRFGDVTEFPQMAAYVGRRDLQDLVEHTYRTPMSEAGNFLGRYVRRRSQSVPLLVEHLSEDWKLDVLDPLLAELRARPVFVADRPAAFPKSVAYAQTKADVVPERDLPQRRVAVTVQFDMVGHVA
jgi:hypothetical protein